MCMYEDLICMFGDLKSLEIVLSPIFSRKWDLIHWGLDAIYLKNDTGSNNS